MIQSGLKQKITVQTKPIQHTASLIVNIERAFDQCRRPRLIDNDGGLLGGSFGNHLGPSRLFGATCEKMQKFRDGLGGPAGQKSRIFGPKTRGGPCADLPRSFGITLSPQKQNPTLFANVFHETLSNKCQKKV